MALTCGHWDMDENGNALERCQRDSWVTVGNRRFCAKHAKGAEAEISKAKDAVLRLAALEREMEREIVEDGEDWDWDAEDMMVQATARRALHKAVDRLQDLGWEPGD